MCNTSPSMHYYLKIHQCVLKRESTVKSAKNKGYLLKHNIFKNLNIPENEIKIFNGLQTTAKIFTVSFFFLAHLS